VYAGHIRVCVRPSFSIVKDNKLTGVQLGYYLARSAFDDGRGLASSKGTPCRIAGSLCPLWARLGQVHPVSELFQKLLTSISRFRALDLGQRRRVRRLRRARRVRARGMRL
jgi:hypothetical protein